MKLSNMSVNIPMSHYCKYHKTKSGQNLQKFHLHVHAVILHLEYCILWDIGKQYSPRCDAAECGVPSGAILFAQRNFVEK